MEILITVSTLLKYLMVVVPSIIAGNTVLTGIVNGAFNVEKGWVKHTISWILAILAGVVTALSGGLPVFASMTANVIFGAICGLFAGGASNGLYDWQAIGNLIDQFYALFGHPTPAEAKALKKQGDNA